MSLFECKKPSRVLLLLSIILIPLWDAFTLPPVSEFTAREMLESRGEVFFSFENPGSDLLSEMMGFLSVDQVTEDRVYAYANLHGFDEFERKQLVYAVHIPPGLLYTNKQFNMVSEIDVDDIQSWDFYPTYEAYESMMHQFAGLFPGLYELVEASTLESGRKILFGVIGKSGQTGGKPRFMYTSTMHGDETVGFALMLRLIHYLLHQYGNDEEITSLIDKLEIWICPHENPDGTYTNDNSTILGATRFNSNNVDLNRSYPVVVSGAQASPIQPETVVMQRLVDSLQFVMSANIHSGIECINFPWDFWLSSDRKHADHEWWQFVSREYADTARFFSHQNYMEPRGPSFFNGVTHGGDWYQVAGSRQDYMNYYAGLRELTLELSNIKLLPADSIENLWQYNYRSLINYMRQATFGVHGMVADLALGSPLHAMIAIPGYDTDHSEVFSSALSGYYFRPLPEGSFDITVSAPSYPTILYQGIETNYYETVFVETDPGMIRFDPLPLVFPPMIAPGETNALLSLKNPGNETLTLFLDSVSGDQVFFAGLPSKQTILLPPGGHAELPLFFRADESGHFTGDLVFSFGMNGQPVILLPMQGQAPEEAAIIFSLYNRYDFGQIQVHHNERTRISLKNNGNLPLSIEGAFLTDAAFSIEADFPLVINPGHYADLLVVFSPDSVRLYNSLMTFGSNAFEPSLQISLSGEGVDGTLTNRELTDSFTASIYPNPLASFSILDFEPDPAGNNLIIISNAMGNTLVEIMLPNPGPGRQQVSMGELYYMLPVGLYFCTIRSGASFITLRFIRQ